MADQTGSLISQGALVVKSFIQKIGSLIRSLVHLDIVHFLEPKKLCVEDYWLCGLVRTEEKHIDTTELVKPEGQRPAALDFAAVQLGEAWATLGDERRSRVVIPIWCFDGLSPFISGVKSFLVADLPITLSRQISSLCLENPVEIKTAVGKDREDALTYTVVDVSSSRIVIIGNVREVLVYLHTLGSRLSFAEEDPREISGRVRQMLSSGYIEPLGTNLLIGGFGAIFGFECAFLGQKLLSIGDGGFWEAFASIVAMLAIVAFLVQEALENRIVAFAAKWNVKVKLFTWILFLGLIISVPCLIFGSVGERILLLYFRLLSIGVILSCGVANLGQIFFQRGLRKKTVLILWATLAFFIGSLPLLDLIQSRWQ